jgi:hypothetical protein
MTICPPRRHCSRMSVPRWIAQFPARVPGTTQPARALTWIQLCSCLEPYAAVPGTAVPVDGMVHAHFAFEWCFYGGKASCSKVNDTMMGCFKKERGIEIKQRVMRLSNEGYVDDMFICGVSDGCAR